MSIKVVKQSKEIPTYEINIEGRDHFWNVLSEREVIELFECLGQELNTQTTFWQKRYWDAEKIIEKQSNWLKEKNDIIKELEELIDKHGEFCPQCGHSKLN